MKMKIMVLLAFISLLSCDKNTIYKQLDSGFADNRWLREDTRQYDFTVDVAQKYNLYIDFSYVAEVQFAQIPLVLVLTMPDGTMAQEELVLQTKDGQGKEMGDCAGDYCDLRQAVFVNRTLAAGAYKVQLRNQFNHEYLPNVIGIGIRVSVPD